MIIFLLPVVAAVGVGVMQALDWIGGRVLARNTKGSNTRRSCEPCRLNLPCAAGVIL